MTYELGVDLGTTFTAAAVRRGDRVDITPLGSRGPVIPSVVLLGDDDTVMVGEAAARRALTDPTRVAREFKRRIGDSLPIIVGGSPRSAESLSALLLGAVVAEVSKLEGGPPARVALTHPANWGAYKIDLYAQAVRFADLPEVVFLTEPEAAAIHYASQERIDDGAVVAVYDLGGGTFDATVLRKTGESFEVLGQPEGIERLGGIDFDQAVFTYVTEALGLDLDALDRSDPAVLSGMARLRQDCIDAKEGLSADTEASIPVALPGLHTEVRLTRPELESMLRRPIADTVAALRRGLRDSGVSESDLSTVLLVGGSSRIPMVAEMVGADLGRPVAIDAHPKYAIAMGAARFAGLPEAMQRRAGGRTDSTKAPDVTNSTSSEPSETAVASASAPAPRADATSPLQSVSEPANEAATTPVDAAPPAEPRDVVAPAPIDPQPPVEPPSVAEPGPTDRSPEPAGPMAEPVPIGLAAATAAPRNKRPLVLAGVAAVLVALIGGGIALAAGGNGGGGGGDDANGDGCPGSGPFICLTTASASDGQLRAQFRTIGATLGTDATASFFLESAPSQSIRWDTPDPFVANAGTVAAGANLCALMNDGSGAPVAGTGNCVPLG